MQGSLKRPIEVYDESNSTPMLFVSNDGNSLISQNRPKSDNIDAGK